MRNLKLTLSGCAAFFCCAGLTGCKTNEAVYAPTGERLVFTHAALPDSADELDKRQGLVNTLAARLSVTLHDLKSGKEHALKGAYIGDKQGNLRLRITASSGHLVLDLSIQNTKVSIWLPRQERYYEGDRAELLSSQSQLALIAQIGQATDLFFPRAWSTGATKRDTRIENGREIISVFEKQNRARQLTVEPENDVVEKMDVFDLQGRDAGTILYRNYNLPWQKTNAAVKAPDTVFPRRVTLRAPDGLHELDLDVDELILNTPIAQSKYVVPIPEGQEKLDMGKALQERPNLWD